jgi:hypothetical protein
MIKLPSSLDEQPGLINPHVRNARLAGVPFITAIGGLFTPAATLAAAQHVALILGQPLIPGAVLLVVLKLVLRPPAT